MDRRDFLKTVGFAAGTVGTAAVGRPARAAQDSKPVNTVAMLIDTTVCVGCRECERACAEQNHLPAPPDDDSVMDKWRDTSVTQYTVVNHFETAKGDTYVRRMCMHCLEPACAAACPTRAMYKTPKGPVIWRGEKCMGCRFCMVSCPFDIPKFEYHSADPRIMKCIQCWPRVRKGEKPACVVNCPAQALDFGPRDKMLELAHSRIAEHPDQYVNHIYGEHEAGGTGMLFLANTDFGKLGFRTDLSTESYPKLTVPFLYSVPMVLTLVPAFLLGLYRATGSNDESEE